MKLKVIKIASSIGCEKRQKNSLLALGLKKINSFRIHDDNRSIRGMIEKVKHLVRVECWVE